MPDPLPPSAPRPSPPPRKRSRLPGWLMALMCVALILIAMIAWVTSRIFASPNPKTDYAAELVKLSEEAQPPGPDNAWPLLISAAEKVSTVDFAYSAKDEEFDIALPLYGPWDADSNRTPLAALEEIRASGAFDDLAAAARMNRAVRNPLVPEPSLSEARLPELGFLRLLAKTRTVDMRCAFVKGDFTDIPPAVNELFALARHLSFQPMAINGLVAHAIRALTESELRHELIEGGFDEATCRSLLRLFESDSALAPLSLSFQGERLNMYDTIQRVFTDDGDGDGHLIPSEYMRLVYMIGGSGPGGSDWSTRLYNVLPVHSPGRAATVAKVDELIEKLGKLSELNAVMRAKENFDLKSEVTSFTPTQNPIDNILLIIFPSLTKTVSARDMLHTESAATRLMLALHIYKLRHNAYPASLSDLVPEILPDPILDPLNNLPFGYRLLTDDPQNRPYLLYSLGLDGLDQQGAMPDLKKYKPDDPTLPDTRKAMTEIIPFDSVIDCVRPPR